ncbi:hypothetical protein SAMN02910265_01054 [Ruminococcus flavefaciens]|uniref:IrrE N-terminal-like domain-containing protein n=1 Tax=Ruminococcus flavefaciens TaxID=1265 RepID=A0A1H6IVQ4_RUMFL|nr:helix-turn-helix transcriptional regulator [Ruminococcus flavefaciens]SEH50562.1 hypothetical protein SAMN02910265_01054 [Ruminococcus flavefaciens]
MRKYKSLKDYIRLNNLEVIIQGLTNHIMAISCANASYSINDIEIHTLVWKSFDQGMLTITIGVSAILISSNGGADSLHYYNISLCGNVISRLSDLHIINIVEVTEEQLQKETVESLFMLPIISADNLEDIAEEFYEKYCPDYLLNPKQKYSFPVVRIKEWVGLKLWYADLPDNCFGRLYLKESTATIYDSSKYPIIDKYENTPIPRGAILLNYNYYYKGNKYDDVITFCHELVHWAMHQSYFILRHMLEDSFETMNCSVDLPNFDGNMTIADKAYWIAEGQANELSIRLAMPKHLVEQAIAEYENNSKGITRDGIYYQSMVEDFELKFNVSREIVKKRLMQLGYDFADGTCVKVDDCHYPAFTFTHGTLKEDETFIIDQSKYEQLLRENKDFEDLIKSNICVYTGAVVCIYNAKYIRHFINNGKNKYVLSDYAMKHADECCVRFNAYYNASAFQNYNYYIQEYLCSLIDKNKRVRFDSNKNETIVEYKHKRALFLQNDKILYDEMVKDGVTTFSEALVYIMDNKKIIDEDFKETKLKKKYLAEFLGCDDKTIQNYRNGSANITIEKAMLICLACETGPKVSMFLIEKSVGGIPDIGIKKIAYEWLLLNTDLPLNEWDRILEEDFHLSPIRFDA